MDETRSGISPVTLEDNTPRYSVDWKQFIMNPFYSR